MTAKPAKRKKEPESPAPDTRGGPRKSGGRGIDFRVSRGALLQLLADVERGLLALSPDKCRVELDCYRSASTSNGRNASVLRLLALGACPEESNQMKATAWALRMVDFIRERMEVAELYLGIHHLDTFANVFRLYGAVQVFRDVPLVQESLRSEAAAARANHRHAPAQDKKKEAQETYKENIGRHPDFKSKKAAIVTLSIHYGRSQRQIERWLSGLPGVRARSPRI